jgi:23S rRNA (cytidine1920-2'-O)/16S rRNA (cytidine1409-2'-O)-methyltransferase
MRHPTLKDYLIEHKFVNDARTVRAMMIGGLIYVNDKKASSLQQKITDLDTVAIRRRRMFVSRGGDKLEDALRVFAVNIHGLVCLDAGAATGGFTDCLLRRGARQVFAVDVAYGKLDWTLRTDNRVINLEKHNIRELSGALGGGTIDCAVVDVSFASLCGILPDILTYMKPGSHIVALIKPQFELPPQDAPGGIVRTEENRARAIEKVRLCGEQHGLRCNGIHASVIQGAKGNQEYFIYWSALR